MQTRPELLLLQKTMVVVEGVARSLDPDLNIWSAAEPIAKQWIEANYGVTGRLREAGEGAEVLGKVMAEVPRLLEQAERTALALADMAQGGFKLATTRWSASPPPRPIRRWTRLALGGCARARGDRRLAHSAGGVKGSDPKAPNPSWAGGGA
jgi:ubiquinone biosynthesis protein